jgi:hypothetical protein
LEDGAPVESGAGYGTGAPLGLDAAVKLGIGAGRIVLLRYPPLRGSRRERLRREAEEARQSIAAGRPVRMTHVLELPPTPGGDDTTPEGSRQMSVAVGEVAKRFAPDLPIGRLVRPWTPTGAAADASASTGAQGGESAGQSGARGSTPPRGAAHAKVPAQQIVAALADAIAAARLEGANESPGAKPHEATPAPRPPRATSAPRSRSYVTAGLLAVAGVAAAVAVALFVRRHHDAGQSATPAAAQTDGNATTSLVPTPPVATTPSPSPVEPPPSTDARPSASSSAAEYARAVATGDTLLKQGRYRPAIAEYRKAVALRPDSVAALIALGDAFLEADQPRNAVKPLQQAARLDPGSARAQLLLGTAFQSLDRPRDAVAAYKRYLDLEPSGEFAGDVRAIVANLSK